MTVEQAYKSAVELHRSGQLAQAERLYRQVLERQPNHANCIQMLGMLACQCNQHAAGVEMIRRAIALNPNVADYHGNLGLGLAGLGDFAGAITEYQLCLKLDPSAAQAYFNLANALRNIGRVEEAISAYQQSLRLRPNHPMSLNNLGSLLRSLGRMDEAIPMFSRAIALQPDLFQAHNNRGNALLAIGDIDGAVESLTRAVALAPKHPKAHNNLANALLARGQVDGAIASYQDAIAYDPADAGVASNRLFALHFHPKWDAPAILREHQAWNQRFAAPLATAILPHENKPDPLKRLRIGFISPDFQAHCQSLFTLPLLRGHDREQVEVFCYADVLKGDVITERLKSLADTWRPTAGMSDDQIARVIRGDQIDILIDLTMHMAHGRPLVLARKPAPVQAAWLAYPGTTGISAVDYRLTDPYLDPPGQYDQCYAERSIRLPDTFWCYDAAGTLESAAEMPAVTPLSAERNGFITFGCFNNICKLNDDVFELWATVMRQVASSRMVIWSPPGLARRWITESLNRRGIDAGRLDFVGRQPRPKFLAEFGRVDLCLDTTPYNGHTTSLDALWMGAPVISLIGKTVVGRAGLSQLSNLGLAELAAPTDEQFVGLARLWGADIPRLSELRRSLRGRMMESPLTDGRRFAQGMEAAYRQMWRTWCRR